MEYILRIWNPTCILNDSSGIFAVHISKITKSVLFYINRNIKKSAIY